MLDLNLTHTFFSENANLKLDKNDSLKLHYQLKNKDYAGIVIPLNELELGENFLIEFEIRGDTRDCKFEVKLASADTVWWIVKPEFNITNHWQKYCFRRRHFSYAWGASQEFLETAKQLELVITAYQDCVGEFEFKNITLKKIPSAKPNDKNTTIKTSSGSNDFFFKNIPWIADDNKRQKIEISFNSPIELGGLIVNWEQNTKCDFELKIKDQQNNLKAIDSITNFNGGTSFHYIPDCDALEIVLEIEKAKNCKINSIEFMGAKFSASWNTFLSNVALRKTRGLYPRYLYKEQSFWTVIAEDGSSDKALINEEGLIEFGYSYPVVDVFVKTNEQLFTWAESIQSQSLRDNFIPKVDRKYKNFHLNISSWMQNNNVFAEYELINTSNENISGCLTLALRPYQVNPPWQFLNTTGGFRAINSIEITNSQVTINDKQKLYTSNSADRYFVNNFDSLENSNLCFESSERGTCSGCFEFDFELKPGEGKKWIITTDRNNFESSYDRAIKNWKNKFSNFNFSFLEDSVRAQLLYIFSNRDGAAIQPGTRCYRRTWIRDGAMTSSALLQFGFSNEVRDFINWFTPYIQENGAVPCVVDSKGIDTTDEHDSHGEYLFLVTEYYRYTKDKQLAEKLFDTLIRVAKHIDSLSSLSLNLEPHLRGLLPKSISHEGYAAGPAYSYWDDLWALRGLEGLAYLSAELKIEQDFCFKLKDKFKNIVFNSLKASLKFHNINFIPGAADLGDFDATSTTIGADPCSLLIEEFYPEFVETFNRYWTLFSEREKNFKNAYTPYEIRIIGTLIRLGEIEKAWHALDFFLLDQRPNGWKHWAEVVFANKNEPGFLGDAPHGWVASDFLRAIRSFLIYEFKDEYYLGAGITKDLWKKGIDVTLIIPEGQIKIISNQNQIEIYGITNFQAWFAFNSKLEKINLPFKISI